MVYVDGAHDTHSVFQDVTGALKIISKNGLICGDDFNWDSVKGGLVLIAIAHRKRLAFYVKENDFVILNTSSSHYGQSLSQFGYVRWKTKEMVKSLLSLSKQFTTERFN